MLTMCFEANLALVTHALYYIHACTLLARLRIASQDGKKNNEAKCITRVPQEARVIKAVMNFIGMLDLQTKVG